MAVKLRQGENDVFTTHNHLVKYFKEKEMSKNITYASHKKIQVVCPECGHEKYIRMADLSNNNNISCVCSDGKSYPCKFMISTLNQLGVKFDIEKRFNWCKYDIDGILRQGIYDFYFILDNNKYVIEVDGIQHKRGFNNPSDAKRQKLIDEIKDKLAKDNGITMIRIDCCYSNAEYISENIKKSKLSDLFDINMVNWDRCHEFSIKSLVKTVCDYWNDGFTSTVEIGEVVGLHFATVRKYLLQGAKANLCDCSMNKLKEHRYKKANRKVICIDTLKVYSSIKEASLEYGLDQRRITECASGRKKTAGKVKWMYYDEYIKN